MGMNKYNAARAAKYSHTVAMHAKEKIESRIDMEDALEQAGLTDKIISEKLVLLTEATKQISCNVFIDKDGEMKNVDGKSLDFIEVPDNSTQINALKLATQLKGQLKPNGVNVNIKNEIKNHVEAKANVYSGFSESDLRELVTLAKKINTANSTPSENRIGEKKLQ